MPPASHNSGDIAVTVVVPAYNAERWLALTLESACQQTLREIEVLVVDDGSSDRTVQVALDFARRDPRVRLICRKNGGVGAARNSAILEARGKYIAPLDADDLWSPDKLAAQVACMEAGGEEMGMCYCWSEKIDANGDRITESYPFDLEGTVLRPLILRNFIGSGSVPMFRTSALREVGNYLERSEQGGVQGCEDWDLSLRLAERHLIGLVPKCLVGYRQLVDCMSLNAAGMSQSFEVIMNRAKGRNPEMPRTVFRWSAGIFYSYLVAKCYLWADYRGCLSSMTKAVAADPILVFNRRFYLMGLKSIVRIVTRTRSRLPSADRGNTDGASSPSPARHRRSSWAEDVQTRRWEEAIAEACCAPKP